MTVDVFFQVARHGSGDLNPLHGQEFGQVFLSGFQQYREIAAVDHAHTQGAGAGDELAKMRIEFRGAAGDVDGLDVPRLQEFDDRGNGFCRHFLGAARAGIDVTVHAALIATVSQIHLQRRKCAAAQAGEAAFVQQWKCVVHEFPILIS